MLEGPILIVILLGAIAGVAVAALVLTLARRRETTVASTPASMPSPDLRPTSAVTPEPDLTLVPASRLPRFTDVGGLDSVKGELRDTLGLVLRDPERAHTYRITWNGVLLHGPPGTGKSFFAHALA